MPIIRLLRNIPIEDYDKIVLTQDEIDAGWHFCYDWDYLLIGPGMSELDGCSCRAQGKSDA